MPVGENEARAAYTVLRMSLEDSHNLAFLRRQAPSTTGAEAVWESVGILPNEASYQITPSAGNVGNVTIRHPLIPAFFRLLICWL